MLQACRADAAADSLPSVTDLIYYRQPLLMKADVRLPDLEFADDGAWARLDRTLVYPGGGGQPADVARIAGIPISGIDLADKHSPRYLLTGPGVSDLRPGATVTVTVDPQHRTDYMEQHSGQHLLSAAMKHLLDLNTVAVHQGPEVTTIEVDRDAPADELGQAVAEAAAGIIAENRPITMREVDEDELETLPLRRPTKRRGRIRIVEISDYDCAACGGVHLPSTGRIGGVALAGTERIRGRTRSAWYIGRRARSEFRKRISEGQVLADLLSTAPGLQADAVGQLLRGVKDREAEIRRLQAEIADLRAQELSVQSGPIVARMHAEARELRATAEAWMGIAEPAVPDGQGSGPTAVLLVGTADSDGQQPVLLCIPEPHGSRLAPRIKTGLLEPLGIRGGGRPPFWQGVMPDTGSLGTAQDILGRLLGE